MKIKYFKTNKSYFNFLNKYKKIKIINISLTQKHIKLQYNMI